MATAKPPPLPPRQRKPRRYGGLTALVCFVLFAAALLVWFWKPINGYALVGASYGARVGCACRHIGGRSLSDCRKDFVPGMALITLSEDAKAKSVTARFALLSRQTATFRAGEGCVLEPWAD
jgi:hypothetical protein